MLKFSKLIVLFIWIFRNTCQKSACGG